ncbi:MAG: WD40 repeat domain-containing protein [Polyangia bacterium]
MAYIDSSGNDTSNSVVIYDALGLKELRRLTVAHWLTQLAFVPGQTTLLYSNGGSLIRVPETGSPTTLSLTDVFWFAISPDGTKLAVLSGALSSVRIYSYPGLSLQTTLTVNIAVANGDADLAFSPDSSQLALSGGYENPQVQVFAVSNGVSHIETATGASATYSPAFTASGTELFVGGGYSDGYVYAFNPATTGTYLRRLVGAISYQYSVAIIPGYSKLLAGGYDNVLRIIDSSTGTVNASYTTSSVINKARFSPDGKYVYVGIGAGSSELVIYRVN